jgi:hypothetical protein
MPKFLFCLAEKSKGLFFASARGPTRHETASALDLPTFCRLPGSIRKSSGKEAQSLVLPPDNLGAHVRHSNSQVPGIVVFFSYNAYSTLLQDVVAKRFLPNSFTSIMSMI